ncbi:hypothetical protein PI125_g15482 [Phytophthora idaei]|nr:hypothetical protein PI125_g15482 [Phytophthora idaei]
MYAPHELSALELRRAIFEALCYVGIDLARFLLPPGKRLVDYAEHLYRVQVAEMLQLPSAF